MGFMGFMGLFRWGGRKQLTVPMGEQSLEQIIADKLACIRDASGRESSSYVELGFVDGKPRCHAWLGFCWNDSVEVVLEPKKAMWRFSDYSPEGRGAAYSANKERWWTDITGQSTVARPVRLIRDELQKHRAYPELVRRASFALVLPPLRYPSP